MTEEDWKTLIFFVFTIVFCVIWRYTPYERRRYAELKKQEELERQKAIADAIRKKTPEEQILEELQMQRQLAEHYHRLLTGGP